MNINNNLYTACVAIHITLHLLTYFTENRKICRAIKIINKNTHPTNFNRNIDLMLLIDAYCVSST